MIIYVVEIAPTGLDLLAISANQFPARSGPTCIFKKKIYFNIYMNNAQCVIRCQLFKWNNVATGGEV